MIKTKRWHFILVLFFVSVFFLASCGSENVNSNNNEASGESNLNNENGVNNESEVPQDSDEPWAYHGDPVTLEMMIWIDQETFNMRYKNQVEEKFPDITLELVSGGTREHLEELFAS